ncbi:MAG: acid phosphatase [Phenylobacterium sp.]|nr:acid phosphatase [Phenylobacterium sp.]
MVWKLVMAAAAIATLGAAPAPAQAPMAASTAQGYLGDAAPDTYKILPPAPVAGTTRYEADRAIYLGTRSLKDTPRWGLAQNDVNQLAILKDLSCAVGVELNQANAPKTVALVARVGRDVSRATDRPKDIYKRQRPYLIDEGPICIDKTDALAKSPDYPSGHNTWGWTVGLIMAELAPDRATEILARARAFGEGRLVCGVHNLSAVEAGRMNGSIVVAALHGQEAFRKDLNVVRKEVAAARKAGPTPDPAACAREAEIVAKSPY